LTREQRVAWILLFRGKGKRVSAKVYHGWPDAGEKEAGKRVMSATLFNPKECEGIVKGRKNHPSPRKRKKRKSKTGGR